MRQGGGRAKGNHFENVIAKQIVKTFEKCGIKKKDCYRTPSSGGHRFAKRKDPGDLVISSRLRKIFPFVPECKSYRKIDLFKLFSTIDHHPKSSQFKQWLAQACKAAEKHKHMHPMLIFKQNQSQVLCAIPNVQPLVVELVTRGKPRLGFQYKEQEWFVVRFDHLLRQLRRGVK